MKGVPLYSSTSWKPTAILQDVRGPIGTSTLPIQVDTDAGRALLKYCGNRQSNHSLALEWVGRALASHLDLPTFDMAVLHLDDEMADRILQAGCTGATAGPALLVRWDVQGGPWSGIASDLGKLVNPDGPARTVVLDTLLRNADRCPPPDADDSELNYSNTWISLRGSRRVWTVFDHTHILCEGVLRAERLDRTAVEDASIYGLFPGLEMRIRKQANAIHQALVRCQSVGPVAASALASCPPEWDVSKSLAGSIVSFLERRAAFLLDFLPGALGLPGRLRLPEEDTSA